MPQRQYIITHDSTKVQGEGSFIKIKAMKYGEAKDLLKSVEKATSDLEKMKMSEQLIFDYVYDWNWVDENDKPLPLPKDDPTVIDSLTQTEIEFIAGLMSNKADKDLKN